MSEGDQEGFTVCNHAKDFKSVRDELETYGVRLTSVENATGRLQTTVSNLQSSVQEIPRETVKAFVAHHEAHEIKVVQSQSTNSEVKGESGNTVGLTGTHITKIIGAVLIFLLVITGHTDKLKAFASWMGF
tara:strand:- start:533 stop:925 length:393 start_codon:yes stop_codon:yes gene_type:complete